VNPKQPIECAFESEVLAAVLQDRWPDRVDAELRAHVTGCAVCADTAAIAGAIDASREQMRACATIPDSGRVWWLAQRRARLEAARAANRPLNAAQAIAVVCGAAVFVACFPVRQWFQGALEGVRSGAAVFEFSTWLGAAAKLLAEHGSLAIAIAALLVFIPAAACLALGRD
jgi:hypothetical protein